MTGRSDAAGEQRTATGRTAGSWTDVRVVVVSTQVMPVLDVLRTRLPGCLPVAVPTVDDVDAELEPNAVILLDLGDGTLGLQAAKRLRSRGIQHGIVVIGTAKDGGLSGVTGLKPPFKLGDLATALQRQRRHRWQLRVVVISTKPQPVLDVLRSKVPGVVPVAVGSVSEVAVEPRDDTVILLDLGDPDRGRQAARALRSRGVRQGIVLIGTEDVDDLPATIGLAPPFTIGELVTAFRRLLVPAGQPGAAASVTDDVPTDVDVEAPAVDPQPTGEDLVGAPEPPRWTGNAPASATAAPDEAAAGLQSARPPPPPAGSTSASRTTEGGRPHDASADAVDGAGSAPGTEPVAPHGQAPETGVASPLRLGATGRVPLVAWDAVAAADPDRLGGHRHPEHAASRQPMASDGAMSGWKRWRKRLSQSADDAAVPGKSDPLYDRMVAIFEATSSIEAIALELPVVTDRAALVEAIVQGATQELQADTVGLWQQWEKRWIPVAQHGLSRLERSMPVGRDQPLLAEIDASCGAILLDPVASFQSYITGLAGATTVSFMAAAVAVGGERFGILCVGRNEPLTEPDLDRLVDLAAEAAVGLGVAQHIERMYELAERMGGRHVIETVALVDQRAHLLDEVSGAWQAAAAGAAEGEDSVEGEGAVQGADVADGQDAAQGEEAVEGADAVGTPSGVQPSPRGRKGGAPGER